MKLSSILLNLANLKQRIDQLAYNYGLIADYVVDYGTSGIWTYRKWASGIAECWGELSYTESFTNPYGNCWYKAHGDIALPSGLFNAPPEIWSSIASNGGIFTSSFYSVETAKIGFYIGSMSQENNAKSLRVMLRAKGLWQNMGGGN